MLRMRPYAVRDSLRWSPAATSVFVGSNNRRDCGTAICLASVNSALCVRDFDAVIKFVYGESWLRVPSVGWRSVQDCHGRRVIATYVGVPSVVPRRRDIYDRWAHSVCWRISWNGEHVARRFRTSKSCIQLLFQCWTVHVLQFHATHSVTSHWAGITLLSGSNEQAEPFSPYLPFPCECACLKLILLYPYNVYTLPLCRLYTMPCSPNIAYQVFQVFKCNSYVSKFVLSTLHRCIQLYKWVFACLLLHIVFFFVFFFSFVSRHLASPEKFWIYLFHVVLSSTSSSSFNSTLSLLRESFHLVSAFLLRPFPGTGSSSIHVITCPASPFFFPSLCPYHLGLVSVIVIVNGAA